MTVNIYDSANQIEREIREMPEFLTLKEAFNVVKSDEAAYELFKKFQNLQMTFQEKQMQGEEFTDEDAQEAQALTEKVQASEKINDLMTKEQAFSMIINDLNRIIMTPVKELYED